MNRLPDTFQTVTDHYSFGPKNPGKGKRDGHRMKTVTGWLTNSSCIAQALSTPTTSLSMCQTNMRAVSQQLQSDLCVTAGHNIVRLCRSWIFLRFTRMKTPKWSGQQRTREVYEYATEAEARARTGRNQVGLKWIDTNKGSAEAPRYRSRLVCTEVRHEGVDLLSNTPFGSPKGFTLCVVCQEDIFFRRRPLVDLNCRCESGPLPR